MRPALRHFPSVGTIQGVHQLKGDATINGFGGKPDLHPKQETTDIVRRFEPLLFGSFRQVILAIHSNFQRGSVSGLPA